MAENQESIPSEEALPVSEIPVEKQKLLEPWIKQLETFGLSDPECISLLFGMGLAYCKKAGLDFDALLGATILAEQTKLADETQPDNEKPETD